MKMNYLVVRFCHPTRDLTSMSALLNMPCFRSWMVGSPRQTPLGEPLAGTNAASYWVTRLEIPAGVGFKEKLVVVVDRLVRIEDTLRDLKTSGGRIEIYLQLLGSVNNGDTIDSALLKIMGELEVDLLIEVFPDG